MAKIDDFRARLSGGGARPSQFRVMLAFPSWVSVAPEAGQAGIFMVKSASLPASTIQPIEVPFRGRMAKIAGEKQFSNWNVTVINDNNFLIRSALEEWSRGILDHASTSGILAPAGYAIPLEVHQLDRNGYPVRKYKFFNCFPQAIQEIQLDFGMAAQIEEYQVEFSVDYWKDITFGDDTGLESSLSLKIGL